MRNATGLGLLLVAATVGCSRAKTPIFAEAAPAPAAAAPVVQFRNVDTLTTTLLPLQAAEQVVGMLKQFDFQMQSADSLSGNWMDIKGDYFSARTRAVSAKGEAIETTTQWQREGETLVKFSSDLPKAQHDLVAQRIKSALSEGEKTVLEQSKQAPGTKTRGTSDY